MIRQIVGCNRILKCLRLPIPMSGVRKQILVARCQSNQPPDHPSNNEFISEEAKDAFNIDESKIRRELFDRLVTSNKVVVFMKGTPKSPRCGFSNAVVQIFRMHGVQYDAHDVLDNEDLREGIKEYTDWPTIPQVFIDGEFVGGCDVLLEMHQNGDLVSTLSKAGITSELLKIQKEIENIKNPKKSRRDY